MSKKKQKTNIETMQSIRRSWNGVKPVTKVMPDKKKYDRKRDRAVRDSDYYPSDGSFYL